MLSFRIAADAMAFMQNLTPEQITESMNQWQGWIMELASNGHFVSTEQLQPSGRVLTGPTAVMTDGPFVEVKEVLGGIIIVLANDLDQATEFAKGCPILPIGGSVEIRPLVPLDLPV